MFLAYDSRQLELIRTHLKDIEDWKTIELHDKYISLDASHTSKSVSLLKVKLICKHVFGYIQAQLNLLKPGLEISLKQDIEWIQNDHLLSIIETKLLKKFRKKTHPQFFFEKQLLQCFFLRDQIQIHCILSLANSRPLLEDEINDLHLCLKHLALDNRYIPLVNEWLYKILLKNHSLGMKLCIRLFEAYPHLLFKENGGGIAFFNYSIQTHDVSFFCFLMAHHATLIDPLLHRIFEKNEKSYSKLLDALFIHLIKNHHKTAIKNLYLWFNNYPKAKHRWAKTLLKMIKSNQKNTNKALISIFSEIYELLSCREKKQFLIRAKGYENLSVFQFLLLKNFDDKDSIPSASYNEYLLAVYACILFWIKDPSYLYCRLEEVFEDSKDEIIKKLISIALKYSNHSLVRLPCYAEKDQKQSDSEEYPTKTSAFFLKLMGFCLQTRCKETLCRANYVASLMAKHDDSFHLFYRYYLKQKNEGKSLNKIECTFIKALSTKTPIKLGLNPHHVSSEKRQLLQSLVNTQEIQKFKSSYWEFKTLFFEQSDNPATTLSNSLKSISKIEGFSTYALENRISWIRDCFFRLPSQEMLTPFIGTEKKPRTISETCLKKILPKSCTYFTPSFTLRHHLMGEAYNNRYLDALEPSALPFQYKCATFYFEGGNLLHAINTQGYMMVLSGGLNVTYSYLIAEAHHTFNDRILQQRIIEKIEQLENQGILTEELINKTKKTLKHVLNRSVSNADASKAIAKIEVIKDTMEKELGYPLVILEPAYGFQQNQLDLHIDMFVLPAPNGVIFLQSHHVTTQTLEHILSQARLSFLERKTLESFLEHALLLRERDEMRLQRIQEELEKKDFIVIPIPGIYINSEYTINYMNAIAGKGNSGDFIITNGFKGIPGESYLRDTFTLILQSAGINSAYFCGSPLNRILETTADIDKESHDYINLSGGLHCRTLEC